MADKNKDKEKKQKPDSMMSLQELMARDEAKDALEAAERKVRAEQEATFNRVKAQMTADMTGESAIPAGKSGLKKTFGLSAEKIKETLDARMSLDAERYNAKGITSVYADSSGTIVMQKGPLNKEQVKDAKIIYKADHAEQTVPIPAAKKYENYAPAHPKEAIAHPPKPADTSVEDQMVAKVAKGFQRIEGIEAHRADVHARAEKAIEANRVANKPKITPQQTPTPPKH